MSASLVELAGPAGKDASSPARGASPSGAAPEPSPPSARDADESVSARPTPSRLTAFDEARLAEARRHADAVHDTLLREARGTRRPSMLLMFAGVLCAAVGAGGLFRTWAPAAALPVVTREASDGAEVVASVVPEATPTRAAFGRSGAVKLHVALPSAPVDFPIEVHGDPAGLEYVWVRASDGVAVGPPRRLDGVTLGAPPRPGIYRLALVKGDDRRVVDGVSLAVLVPFAYKLGSSSLNGYRIGTYASERWGGERPLGFLEVDAGAADLPVSEHLRLRDFLTRDQQTQWPRYAVLSPRILDKMELVLAEVYKLRGRQVKVEIDVHSGFRTPLHNARVEGAAVNSRHQYGDAVDIAIDADGDGRLTSFDGRVVAAIVEFIESKNPELVGGLGVYVGPGHASPYVHIDARGTRARWWG